MALTQVRQMPVSPLPVNTPSGMPNRVAIVSAQMPSAAVFSTRGHTRSRTGR